MDVRVASFVSRSDVSLERRHTLWAHNNTAWAAILADRALSEDLSRARALAERALEASMAGGFAYLQGDARQILTRC